MTRDDKNQVPIHPNIAKELFNAPDVARIQRERPITETQKLLRDYRSTDAIKNDIDFLDEVLCDWRVALNIDGFWVDTHTSKRIHNNHLRSMIRRVYLENKRPLKGKALDILIKGYLDSKYKAAMHFYTHDPNNEIFVEIPEVKDTYL
jgi:hypothetical protein